MRRFVGMRLSGLPTDETTIRCEPFMAEILRKTGRLACRATQVRVILPHGRPLEYATGEIDNIAGRHVHEGGAE